MTTRRVTLNYMLFGASLWLFVKIGYGYAGDFNTNHCYMKETSEKK